MLREPVPLIFKYSVCFAKKFYEVFLVKFLLKKHTFNFFYPTVQIHSSETASFYQRI